MSAEGRPKLLLGHKAAGALAIQQATTLERSRISMLRTFPRPKAVYRHDQGNQVEYEVIYDRELCSAFGFAHERSERLAKDQCPAQALAPKALQISNYAHCQSQQGSVDGT